MGKDSCVHGELALDARKISRLLPELSIAKIEPCSVTVTEVPSTWIPGGKGFVVHARPPSTDTATSLSRRRQAGSETLRGAMACAREDSDLEEFVTFADEAFELHAASNIAVNTVIPITFAIC